MGDMMGKGGSENVGPRTAAQQSQGLYSWAAPIMQQGLNMQSAMTDAYFPAMQQYAQGQPFNTPLARPLDSIQMAVDQMTPAQVAAVERMTPAQAAAAQVGNIPLN
jgi:hypothetical protein